MVLAAGYAGFPSYETFNDVWLSVNGGYMWNLCTQDAEWSDRRYLMTLVDSAGYLWIMGGRGISGTDLNDGQRSTAPPPSYPIPRPLSR